MANSSLTRTQSTPTNDKIGTLSFWIKKSSVTTDEHFYNVYIDGNDRGFINFTSTDELQIAQKTGGSTEMQLITNRLFRDTSARYHIVIAFDTTQSTASNRVKVYVNGIQETSFSTSTYPAQNADIRFFSITSVYIGTQGNNSAYFSGYMSHVSMVDGQALAPTVFGETDSTSGIWKFKSPSGVTWGTNGFHLKFENSAALGTDSSGNSNTFTVNGNLKQALDTPSNVHATLDAIQYKTSALTYSNGNTTVSFPGAWVFALSQWGVSSGKWYWEAKCNSGNNANSFYGICAEMVPTGNGFYNNSQNGAIMYKVGSGETYIDATNNASGYSPSINNTDIVGLALDLDSGTKTLKIYKNGTLLSSGGTINLSSYYNDTLVFPCFSGNSSSASCSFDVNFGNGFFGTTAITSAGSNGNGSLFEYDVPSGYYALNTKNINTYG